MAGSIIRSNYSQAAGFLLHTGDGRAGMGAVRLLVSKAVDTITARRMPAAGPAGPAPEGEEEPALGYWHNLPYLIGRVAERGSAVVGAAVTLYVNGKPARPAVEAGWTNPYLTNAATRGFYSFLPTSCRSSARPRHFRLRRTVEHPDYREAVLERTLQTDGEYSPLARIDSDRILNLGTLERARR